MHTILDVEFTFQYGSPQLSQSPWLASPVRDEQHRRESTPKSASRFIEGKKPWLDFTLDHANNLFIHIKNWTLDSLLDFSPPLWPQELSAYGTRVGLRTSF